MRSDTTRAPRRSLSSWVGVVRYASSLPPGEVCVSLRGPGVPLVARAIAAQSSSRGPLPAADGSPGGAAARKRAPMTSAAAAEACLLLLPGSGHQHRHGRRRGGGPLGKGLSSVCAAQAAADRSDLTGGRRPRSGMLLLPQRRAAAGARGRYRRCSNDTMSLFLPSPPPPHRSIPAATSRASSARDEAPERRRRASRADDWDRRTRRTIWARVDAICIFILLCRRLAASGGGVSDVEQGCCPNIPERCDQLPPTSMVFSPRSLSADSPPPTYPLPPSSSPKTQHGRQPRGIQQHDREERNSALGVTLPPLPWSGGAFTRPAASCADQRRCQVRYATPPPLPGAQRTPHSNNRPSRLAQAIDDASLARRRRRHRSARLPSFPLARLPGVERR
ncbi:hypothetical protein HPB48_025180 [Haemaphysalis longicornis]|uniref:Uncharacterized protein n=1 Tax=Haemaphysalis longicornis TaxID=44386 RepID=A0A9J6H759_HAELO|nr:hypothetical protein HPB48_025180 [Haemaphysalis longicornis]